MICCYQVTKFFSTRYGSAIASSAWGPCKFGPFTDLAISVFREMSIKSVYQKSSRLLNVIPPAEGVTNFRVKEANTVNSDDITVLSAQAFWRTRSSQAPQITTHVVAELQLNDWSLLQCATLGRSSQCVGYSFPWQTNPWRRRW